MSVVTRRIFFKQVKAVGTFGLIPPASLVEAGLHLSTYCNAYWTVWNHYMNRGEGC